MTPKEKAIELVNKFDNYTSYEWWEGENGHKENMKQCALIAVDEIVRLLTPIASLNYELTVSYWFEVKREIEAL